MASAAIASNAGSEWLAASEVQQRFMQHGLPKVTTVSYSARCRQVNELGGDCYHFMSLPENRVAIAVGDASGKGLAAALMISNVQSSLRTAALFNGNDTAATVDVVNRQVCDASLDDRYATLFYGVFDASTRRLHYVNAGHNPPIVIRRDGSVQKLEAGGAPVGIFPEAGYEAGTVQLHSGDLVVAYTDGVVEARNAAGAEWQIEGLSRAAAGCDTRSVEAIVDAIFSAMDQYSCGVQSDDATVAVLRVQ